ncbi:MAG: DUF4405 domain-containing protein [Spirochaetota bacterium]
MRRTLIVKLGIDVIMTILLMLAMSFRLTGGMRHEIIGISLCVLIILHNILNRRWYKSIPKGKHNALRNISTGVNLLFLAAMAVLFVSAAFISNIISGFLSLNGSFFMRQIHVAAAYWGFILMSVHIGMHGRMILLVVRKISGIVEFNRICIIAMRIGALLITVYGIKSSFGRNIGSKLIMYYSFDVMNYDESAVLAIAAYLSIMGAYIAGTYYILKLFRTVINRNFINRLLKNSILGKN